jgi:4-amino-4-deoxy-L-arabinose transferase-like glycosyltransferase
VAAAFATRRLQPLLIILAAFLLCTTLFFGIVSLDPDAGRDYVLAELLAHGRVLYRDVFYFFGPVAPWVNALLFRIFGPGVLVLLLAGAGLAFAIVLLTYLVARQILPPLAATVAALLVLLHAVYSYNTFCYATPYTFAAVYGLLFALTTLYSALRALDDPRSRWDLLAGSSAALALASKQEFGLIAAATLVLALGVRWWRDREFPWAAASGSGLACALLTGAFAVALFRQVSFAEFTRSFVPKEATAWRYFYENVQYWGPNWWRGVRESTGGFLLNFGFIVWAVAAVSLFAALARGERPPRRVALAVLAATPLWLWQFSYLSYYPLLLHAIVLALAASGRIRQDRWKVLLLAGSAAIFLMRVLPRPATIGYYGLSYFAPSAVVYLYLCFVLAGSWLSRWFPVQQVQKSMAAVFLICFGVPHLFALNTRWAGAERIATERGAVRVERFEAAKARVVLEEIRRYSQPGDPILMIPHGPMYYFVSGRRVPSRYLTYVYGQILDGPDEREEIGRLAQVHPRLVVIDDFHHVQHIPGPVNTFGAAYNAELYGWILKNYQEVRTIQYQDRLVHFFIPNEYDRTLVTVSAPPAR